MINKIIDFAIRQKYFVLALTFLVAVLGVYSINHIPIDAFPDVTNIQVQVLAEAPGLSPVEVEKLVTFPVEAAMSGLPDLFEIRSVSKFGLSVVTVVFNDGVDIYFARQLVLERLQNAKADLPDYIPQPEMGPITSGMGEIYQYYLHSDSLDIMELRSIQDFFVKPQLRTVPGVTEINSFGGLVKQYHVNVDPAKLLSYDLTLDKVFDAVSKNNSVAGANYLEHANEQYIIRGLGMVEKIEDIENIVLKNEGGSPVYVKNVANVILGSEVRQGAVTANGEKEVSAAIVMMLRGENSREVISRIKSKVEDINNTLPAGVKIKPYYDQTDLVDKTIQTVKTNLFEGGILVIVILFLFLGNIRAALIVASIIPLSLLIAFIGMDRFGLSANLMSLGAIDFGLIVDGSVIIVENCVRLLQLKRKELGRALTPSERIDVIKSGTIQVRKASQFGELIILTVYLPIVTLTGIEGKMFTPMALTVIFALGGALVLSFTFIPALSVLLLREGKEHKELKFVEKLKSYYSPLLIKSLNNGKVIISGLMILLLLSFSSFFFIGSEFVPELDEGSLLIQPIKIPSISLEEANRIDLLVEKELKKFPEVIDAVSRLGRADIASDPMGLNISDIYVTLKDKSEWVSASSKEELIEKIMVPLRKIPGVNYNITQPIAMRVDELVSGVKSDIAVKLFGDDLDILKKKADEIAGVLSLTEGAADINVEQVIGQPYINIKIKRDEIARYGLNIENVQNIISIAIGGIEATEVIEGQARVDVVVKYNPEARSSFEKIQNTLVPLPSGGTLPLNRLADIVITEGPGQVSREFGQRRIVVECNVRGTDIVSFVNNAKDNITKNVDLPDGYYITWGGQFEQRESAMNRLLIVVPLALLIIFILLFTTFNNLRHPAIILLNIPFALSGGLLALLIRDMTLSVSAIIGFIALFGVAVLNGIVLIAYYNQLRNDGNSLFESVLKGSLDRLRPVLMTALVASFGFIPMAFSYGPGSEVQRPLATVVIGGLITATILTLIILPLIYKWLEEKVQK